MSLPPLQLRPISTSHYFASGDVTIQEGAAIAPGVLLQADPGSRIVVKAGACIGIGSILHAHQGTIEVGEGANIGAEVLLVGQVTIGANACVGSATTILNSAIEAGRVISSGSLIGDTSRSGEELRVTDTVALPRADAVQPGNSFNRADSSTATPAVVPLNPSEAAMSAPVESSGVNVYGQVYVNQLLVKMFPNARQQPNVPPQADKPSLAEDPWDD